MPIVMGISTNENVCESDRNTNDTVIHSPSATITMNGMHHQRRGWVDASGADDGRNVMATPRTARTTLNVQTRRRWSSSMQRGHRRSAGSG